MTSQIAAAALGQLLGSKPRTGTHLALQFQYGQPAASSAAAATRGFAGVSGGALPGADLARKGTHAGQRLLAEGAAQA